MKLTPLQRHRLEEALRNSAEVLREIKRETLKGNALKKMKIIEEAVGNLEIALLCP